MPSDIPRARSLIKVVMDRLYVEGGGYSDLADQLMDALVLMRRHPAVRQARSKMPEITDGMKVQIYALGEDENLSQSEIALRVGLPASAGGRVSEVLNGLR